MSIIVTMLNAGCSEASHSQAFLTALKKAHSYYEATAGAEYPGLERAMQTPGGNANATMMWLGALMQKDYKSQIDGSIDGLAQASRNFRQLAKQSGFPSELNIDFQRYSEIIQRNRAFFMSANTLDLLERWANDYAEEGSLFEKLADGVSRLAPDHDTKATGEITKTKYDEHLGSAVTARGGVRDAYAPQSAQSISTDEKEVAVISTTEGDMVIEFWTDAAPKTIENFKKLAKFGFYDGTAFHRIMKSFMVQGGDPNTKDPNNKAAYGMGGPGYTIQDEKNSHKHERGVIAMGNTGAPNSAGSQFYICLAPQPMLDQMNYTTFGHLIKGDDVLEKIGNTPVGPDARGELSAPTKHVGIISIKIAFANSANQHVVLSAQREPATGAVVAPSGDPATQWLSKGDMAGKSNNWAEAERFYDKALQASPTNAAALVSKGFAILQSLRRGGDRESLVYFDRAVEVDPTRCDAWFCKAIMEQIFAWPVHFWDSPEFAGKTPHTLTSAESADALRIASQHCEAAIKAYGKFLTLARSGIGNSVAGWTTLSMESENILVPGRFDPTFMTAKIKEAQDNLNTMLRLKEDFRDRKVDPPLFIDERTLDRILNSVNSVK
jgi:peptidyl-prolyl cis-trans isomerase B (cyclophilin B)